MSGAGPEDHRSEGGLAYAFLAVATSTALIIVLRGTMAVWPVGLAGTLSRIVSAGVLLFWIGWRGEGWRRLRVEGAGRPLLLMGAISIGLNLCWFAGLKWTTATNAILLFRSDLLFVLLIGALLGVEAISGIGWSVVALMLGGFALLMEVQTLDWGGHARGDALIILSALGLAANAFVIRRILLEMDGEAVAVYNHALSGLGFAVLLFLEGGRLPEQVLAQPAQWGWVVGFGLLAAVSLPLYYAALGRLAVWKLRVLMLLSAPLGAVVDWMLWGVVLSPAQLWGGAMLVTGASLLVFMERSSPGPAGRGQRRLPPYRGSAAMQHRSFGRNAPTALRRLTRLPRCRSLADE